MPFRFWMAWLLLIPYWIALAISTHTPSGAEKSIYKYDKLLHFTAFAGLAFLLAWSLPRPWRSARTYLCIFIVAALYGALDEWTQGFIRGRSPDPWDWLADLCGAATGVATFVATSLAFNSWASAAGSYRD